MKLHATGFGIKTPPGLSPSKVGGGEQRSGGGRSFADVVADSKKERQTVSEMVDGFVRSWDGAVQKQERLMRQVPSTMRRFVELQFQVNTLNLQAQLLTKAGESVSGTLQKVQQMGGS